MDLLGSTPIELSDDDSLVGDDTGDAGPSRWACAACTFANSPLLQACEVCEAPRPAEPKAVAEPRGLPGALSLVVDLTADGPDLGPGAAGDSDFELARRLQREFDLVGPGLTLEEIRRRQAQEQQDAELARRLAETASASPTRPRSSPYPHLAPPGTPDAGGEADEHTSPRSPAASASASPPASTELRVAEDGKAYSRAEFIVFYGLSGPREWEKAPRFQLPPDVLKDHRESVHTWLSTSAKSIKIRQVDENPHSRPGTPLYERFVRSWASVADQTVRLAFHGTPEANIASICATGLDPTLRKGQAHGVGEYFGQDASVSLGYCRGGRKMLVVAVLMDRSGLTVSESAERHRMLVCNKPEHQLPLFVLTLDTPAPPARAPARAARKAKKAAKAPPKRRERERRERLLQEQQARERLRKAREELERQRRLRKAKKAKKLEPKKKNRDLVAKKKVKKVVRKVARRF